MLDAQTLATLHSFGGVMNLHDYQALGGELFVADCCRKGAIAVFDIHSGQLRRTLRGAFSGLSKLAVREDRLYVFDEDQ